MQGTRELENQRNWITREPENCMEKQGTRELENRGTRELGNQRTGEPEN